MDMEWNWLAMVILIQIKSGSMNSTLSLSKFHFSHQHYVCGWYKWSICGLCVTIQRVLDVCVCHIFDLVYQLEWKLKLTGNAIQGKVCVCVQSYN